MSRHTHLVLCTGMQGAGKTFLTRKQLDDYLRIHPNRSVLVFDPNDEADYKNIYPIYWDILDVMRAREEERKSNHTKRRITKSEKIVSSLKGGMMYKVLPYTVNGEKMNDAQMRETMISLCKRYGNGLLLLDDVNAYISNFEATEVTSSLKNLRHKSMDLMMHLQSLNPIRRIHIETTRVIRMHRDNMDLSIIKSKLGSKFDVLSIAKFLIDLKFKEYKDKYPFVYIHTNEKLIKGNFSKQDYLKACQKFLKREPSVLRPYLISNNRNYDMAVKEWMGDNDFYGN